MAQIRKGYYRAGHYVQPAGISKRAKKPATWMIIAAIVLAIYAWNSLFGSDSDESNPTPQKSGSSAATPSR